jgi:hypothetical protein
MAQYYYDGHGNRHKLLSEKEKNDEDSARGIGFLVLLCLFVFLVNAPGTLIISLFANSIETTTSAWIWSLVADTVLFFTIYILLKRWMWTFILYAVLSIISAVIIFMNTDNRNIDKTMDNLYFFYTSENHSSIEKPDDAIWKDFFIAEQITTSPNVGRESTECQTRMGRNGKAGREISHTVRPV